MIYNCNMTVNYRATDKDIRAINEALSLIWYPKMKFVFREPKRIENTLVVSYDSKFIYLWISKELSTFKPISKTKKYYLYQLPHNLKLKDEWQGAWWANIVSKEIEKYLPKEVKEENRFKIPIISGGLLGPFTKLQKAKRVLGNLYTSKESYLATIIHEFGHIYWNSYKLWWYSDKKENLGYLNLAVNLYSRKQKQNLQKNFLFRLPSPTYLGEVFAFCTEYYASELFWKNHIRNLEIFTRNRLSRLTTFEEEKDLDRENSIIEPNTLPHDFASVIGKIILAKYPTTWPEILTKPSFIY